MSEYIQPTEVAKRVRAALKHVWPETKFSVRTSQYAGGASIDVGYVDGPAQSFVDAFLHNFTGAAVSPDGDAMDRRETTLADGSAVHYGVQHIFARRSVSPEVRQRVTADLAQRLGVAEIDPARWYDVPAAYAAEIDFTYTDGTGFLLVNHLAEREARALRPQEAQK